MRLLTERYIKHFRTKRGGWTKKQLAAIGVSWPPHKGWIAEVVGKKIDDEAAKAFESREAK